MANLHRLREALVLGYFGDVLDEDEFMLLYDGNRPMNVDFNYKDYQEFDLENYNDDECNSYFRYVGPQAPSLHL